jgi:hypothetical protein
MHLLHKPKTSYILKRKEYMFVAKGVEAIIFATMVSGHHIEKRHRLRRQGPSATAPIVDDGLDSKEDGG